MKFILILACLAVFVACTQAQRCRGSVRRGEPNCIGGRNSGTGGRRRQCRRNSNDHMWYYNERERACRRMSYRGCGGNRNRYCSLEACEQRCIRPVTLPSTRPPPETSAASAEPAPAEPEATNAPEAAATNSGAATGSA